MWLNHVGHYLHYLLSCSVAVSLSLDEKSSHHFCEFHLPLGIKRTVNGLFEAGDKRIVGSLQKWQRRFFVLYEHGCLRFALDESVSSSFPKPGATPTCTFPFSHFPMLQLSAAPSKLKLLSVLFPPRFHVSGCSRSLSFFLYICDLCQLKGAVINCRIMTQEVSPNVNITFRFSNSFWKCVRYAFVLKSWNPYWKTWLF